MVKSEGGNFTLRLPPKNNRLTSSVSGEAGKANVLVNPLSVLTPGFLRRVFEIGIGLGDGDKDPLPELEEPDLTE